MHACMCAGVWVCGWQVRVEELRQRSNSQMEKANGLREKAVGMLRRMGGEVEPELEDQTDISNKKVSQPATTHQPNVREAGVRHYATAWLRQRVGGAG